MGREPSYTRNSVILDGLRSAGVEVIDYTDSSGSYALRYARSIARFAARPPREADAIFVGFFGQPLVPVISRLSRKPIVFDAFLSGYDTMCFDRKRFRPGSLPGRFFYRLDKSSCERSDLVLLDTGQHVRYFVETFGLDSDKFEWVPVGADPALFSPREARAAAMLAGESDIHFTVVGTGQESGAIQRLAGSLGLRNTDFIDWVPYERLPDRIAAADVCLGGHFGTVEKSRRVIAGKEYQFLAMAKPTIAGDNPANRELLTDGRDALLVRMGDARAIADAVLRLRDDVALRESIARNGYECFLRRATPEIIGRRIADLASAVIDRR